MSALGVHGDPGGWQHAGYTLGAAVSQLTAELQAADAIGGSGLGPAWYGPVAASYVAAWKARHGRYGDLIYQVRRGSEALIDFGERLADFQVRAARLEWHWLSTGLHLTADGLRFTLPHGYMGLAHDILATLRGFEAEAASDIAAMWRDIAGAVADLVTILESVINALEDYQAISYTAVHAGLAWAVNSTLDDLRKKPWETPGELILMRMKAIEVRADHNLQVAKALDAKWSKDVDSDVRTAGRALVRDAKEDVKAAEPLKGMAKIGDHALTAVNVAYTVVETTTTARKKGWINSIEDHSDDLASLAAGFAVAAATDALMGTAVVAGAVAAAPVLVPVGIVLGGGLLCAGVGALVKYEVDQHRAGTTQVLTQIGDETGLIAQPAY